MLPRCTTTAHWCICHVRSCRVTYPWIAASESCRTAASGPKTPLVSMATAMKWWLASSSAYILHVLCCSAWAATKLAFPDTNSRCEGQCVRTCHVPHHRTWPRLQGMMEALSGDLPSAEWHPTVNWPYIGMLLANCWFPDQFFEKRATWKCDPLYKVLLLLWPHMIVSSSALHSVLFAALHSCTLIYIQPNRFAEIPCHHHA